MIKTSSLPLGRISLLLAILVWLALVLVDLVRIFGMINNLDSGISEEVTWILEILFFFFVYLVYRHIFWKNRNADFLTLIWRGVSTGLFAAASGLLTELIYLAFGESKIGTDPFLNNIFYHVFCLFQPQQFGLQFPVWIGHPSGNIHSIGGQFEMDSLPQF